MSRLSYFTFGLRLESLESVCDDTHGLLIICILSLREKFFGGTPDHHGSHCLSALGISG